MRTNSSVMLRIAHLVAAVLLAVPVTLNAQPSRGDKPAPKLANPGAIVQQLIRMTPEERERAIEKLPLARQDQVRENLRRFDNLPKAEQERRLRLVEMFAGLPPEKQDLVRRQIQAFNHLPDERRRLVGAAFQRLRRMSEDDRQARLASRPFRNRFTPAEQQIIADLAENLPPPAPGPVRPEQ